MRHVRRPSRRSLAALLVGGTLIATVALAVDTPALGPYPAAALGDVVENHFGRPVADPYRWLEDLDSPATRAFTSAQDALTSRYLASLPGRKQLHKRLTQLFHYVRYGTPFTAGGEVFYTMNTGLQNQSVLYRSSGRDGARTMVLDPNTLSADGHLAVVGYVPSHDGRRLAYGVSDAGSDWTEWHIRELSTGQDLPDVLAHTKYYPPVWTADDRALIYSAFPAPKPGEELAAEDLNNALYRHVLGAPASADVRLYGDDAHPDRQFLPSLSDDGRWLVIASGEGEVGDKGLEDIVLIDTTTQVPAPMTTRFTAAFVYAGSTDSRLYFVTTDGAPNGRVIAVDPTNPARANWKEIIAEGTETITVSEPAVSVVGNRILVQKLHDAHSAVSVHDLDGHLLHTLKLPGAGSVQGFSGRAKDPTTYYSYADALTPRTVYRYDVATDRSTLLQAPKVAFKRSDFVAEQVFYPSFDGTRVPMTLVHKKGLRRNGRNPTLLYAYGGFGIPELPRFGADRIAWIERGGIFAVANIRGGGEYGEQWHRAAIVEHRQVAFNDFQAAAEWLSREHYTSPSRLAIQGGSNGGLLMGVSVTQRPALYGAVIAEVGVMDMLRFDRFGQGAGWTGDFGSPNEESAFRAIVRYSPVHNVRKGIEYPATLIVTGDHDTRVFPAHSFKFAAALQAAQAGPAPILLMLEKASGHGGGTNVSQAIDQNTDIYAFLWRALASDRSPKKDGETHN
jgi:prolyl oligopeptidase